MNEAASSRQMGQEVGWKGGADGAWWVVTRSQTWGGQGAVKSFASGCGVLGEEVLGQHQLQTRQKRTRHIGMALRLLKNLAPQRGRPEDRGPAEPHNHLRRAVYTTLFRRQRWRWRIPKGFL